MNVYEIRNDVSKFASILFSNRNDAELWPTFDGISLKKDWKAFEGCLDDKYPPGDFSYIGPGNLICSDNALQLLDAHLKDEYETLPLKIKGFGYSLLNPLVIEDCLDESKSEINRFKNSDRISDIKKYVFAANKVPSTYIFKLPQLVRSNIFGNEKFKNLIEQNKLNGLKFIPHPAL